MSLVSISETSRLAYVAEQTSLSLTLSHTPMVGFLMTWLVKPDSVVHPSFTFLNKNFSKASRRIEFPPYLQDIIAKK